jgi:hypothetical protein
MLMKLKTGVRIFRLVSATFAAIAAVSILISMDVAHDAICTSAKIPGLESPLPLVVWSAGLWFVLALLLALKNTPLGISDFVSCLTLFLGYLSIRSSIDSVVELKNIQGQLNCSTAGVGDFSGILDVYLDQLGLQEAMSIILVLMFLLSWSIGKIVTR